MLYYDDSERPITYDNKSRVGDEPVDVFQPEGLDYPIIERMNNALVWPEGPKGRIDLQEEAYNKEKNISSKLFEVYEEQRKGLAALKAKYGAIVSVEQLMESTGNMSVL